MELLTKAKQTPPTLEEKKKAEKEMIERDRPGFYFDHISFFLEPYPVHMAGKVYGKDHHTWFPGSKLFEHVVESDDISDFVYEIVEYPERTELYLNDKISNEVYFKKIEELRKELKLVGKKEDFNMAAERYIGEVEKNIQRLPSVPAFKNFKHLYAGLVVHCMIYPKSGTIKILSSKEVKVM